MATIDSVFEQQWSKEAKLAYQQTESKLVGTTREVRASVASLNFQKFSKIDAITGKARHADVTIQAQDVSKPVATSAWIYAAQMIDDADMAVVNFNYRDTISQMCAGAIRKAYDGVIINALALTGNTATAAPTANAYKYDAAEKASAILTDRNVPEENRFGLISTGARSDLLNDTVYVNNFHYKNEVIAKGVAKNVAGFDLIVHTGLPAGSVGKKCFMWHKDAVGTLITQDFSIKIDWVPEKQGYLFVAKMQVGAVIIDDDGIVWMDIANNT